MAEPNPSNVSPWYLRNINQALALDELSGNVYLRTGFTGDIIISGNVQIPGTVTVDSTPEDPVHVHLDEVGTSGILDVPWLPVGLDGNSNVTVRGGNINAAVTGTVVAGISGGNSNVTVTGGNINAIVTGNVGANITGGNINANITGGNLNANITGGNIRANVTGNVEANVTGGNIRANVTGNVNANVTGGNVGILGNVTILQGNAPWTVTPTVQTVQNAPFEWQVARGLIPGATQVSIFGFNANVGITPTTIWDVSADYTFPTVASQLTLASTSPTDSNSARVQVTGLNANWDPVVEVVALNGTNNVLTSNLFIRINQMRMLVPGVGQITNAGTITAKINGTTYAQINPGLGKTQMGVYSVARNHIFLSQHVSAYSGDATGTSKFMHFQINITDNVSTNEYVLQQTTWQNSFDFYRQNPLKYGEKLDLRWKLFTNSGTATGAIIVEGTLIDLSVI